MVTEELQPGDTVRVKSGGEKMTIATVGDDAGTPIAYCIWFDGKKRMTGDFPLVTLEKAKRSGPPISVGNYED
jgi:uncharacterized protein YodC (DUF2158 family)